MHFWIKIKAGANINAFIRFMELFELIGLLNFSNSLLALKNRLKEVTEFIHELMEKAAVHVNVDELR